MTNSTSPVRTMARGVGAAVMLLAPFAGCSDGGNRAPEVRPLAAPAGPGAAQPSLVTDAAGRAVLTWTESGGGDAGEAGRAALRMAVLADSAWSEPATVAADRDFFVNWADFPAALPLADGRLAVHWLEREGADTYAYGVRIALSDGAGGWSAPIRPHTDSTETEHGFVSMVPAADGVEAIWLDGRAYATGSNEMSLRRAVVDGDSAGAHALLDARVCDCCQTDAAMTDQGPVVVYRDRSPGEIRDIALVRRTPGGWSDPAIVHADGWEIDGCPVNGPAVAARGQRVAVAWFTAAQDSPRVLLAFSDDGGARFGPPVRIDGGDPVGRVDVALLPDGTAVVSWIEEGEATGELRLRTVAPDGAAAAAVTVAPVSGARAAGFPRMTVVGEDLVMAWTDPEAGTIRTARVAVR